MDVALKIEAYYEKEHPFKEGISSLRDLALKTKAEESFKWQSPVYCLHGKNVFWIARFKNHFGLGFFNGIFLKDPKKLLINAQEGKTQAMRHLKFTSHEQIDPVSVLAFMNEALENQEKGMHFSPDKGQKQTSSLPTLLESTFAEHPHIKEAFYDLPPYKQREYVAYISGAKQDKTKRSRLQKILPLIQAGTGLNDKYRPK